MRKAISAIALAIAVIASTAAAQVTDTIAGRAQNEAFNGRNAFLVYAVQDGRGWNLVSVFSQPFGPAVSTQPTAPRRWVARRQAGWSDTLSGVVTWADSATCPQLAGVLWSLHQAEVPSFEVPGIAALRPDAGVEPVPVPTHGPVFTIWGRGSQPSGALTWMRVQPFGGELANWGLNAERHLANCWTTDVPLAEYPN
ncbi:hypothetical protein GCM10009116_19870 [Brevundimonas basaltis]|uniref:Uncharacterized protein n=1 Tax=Brevundimonas basaltis TaxID=472166 RepID=A0A7W8HXH1_9CAUL|nr:hypothetical protein [Brevundimonas basaltis]MBB5291739.1 hypothetical protein [Brevundimonas basaltis]